VLRDRVDHQDPDVVAVDEVDRVAGVAAADVEHELAGPDAKVAEPVEQDLRPAWVEALADDGGELDVGLVVPELAVELLVPSCWTSLRRPLGPDHGRTRRPAGSPSRQPITRRAGAGEPITPGSPQRRGA
jgi:hypothetical protein